jgi:hypothetical protein
LCFDAFSLREPVSTSLENAMGRTDRILPIPGPLLPAHLFHAIAHLTCCIAAAMNKPCKGLQGFAFNGAL